MSYTGLRLTGRNAITTRPADKPQAVAGDTWARDRSSAGADDGTDIDATWVNRVRAVIEAAVAALDASKLADGDAQLANALLSSLADYATLDSPALTGTPTAPTPDVGSDDQRIATTGFVVAALDALVNAAPGSLDTLNELAQALGDDPNFAATVTAALATKAPQATTYTKTEVDGGFHAKGASLTPTSNDGAALGASGIAWSDLFLASGAVIKFNDGDVILTHGANQITVSGGLWFCSYPGTPLRARNTTDAATNVACILESDRATPATWDTVTQDFYLSNSAGTQTLFARIGCTTPNITAGAEESRLDFSTKVSGTLATRMSLLSTALFPTTHDTLTLGVNYGRWSDLFLASGATIQFGAGGSTDAQITHSAGVLNVSTGALQVGGTNVALVTDIGGGANITHESAAPAFTTSSGTDVVAWTSAEIVKVGAQAAARMLLVDIAAALTASRNGLNAGAVMTLQRRTFDGSTWSAWENASAALTLHVNAVATATAITGTLSDIATVDLTNKTKAQVQILARVLTTGSTPSLTLNAVRLRTQEVRQ